MWQPDSVNRAIQRLREYIVKGFVLDNERLKNPDQPFLFR
jgi:hypothetical protein